MPLFLGGSQKNTEVSMMIEAEYWEAAYKKLKASVYYDKTQALLRDKIVEYEQKYSFDSNQLCAHFKKLHDILLDKSSKSWAEYSKEIIDDITVSCFQKKMYVGSVNTVANNAGSRTRDGKEKLSDVVINMRTGDATMN